MKRRHDLVGLVACELSLTTPLALLGPVSNPWLKLHVSNYLALNLRMSDEIGAVAKS